MANISEDQLEALRAQLGQAGQNPAPPLMPPQFMQQANGNTIPQQASPMQGTGMPNMGQPGMPMSQQVNPMQGAGSPNMGQPGTTAPQQRPSAQEAMKARMRASGTQAATPPVLMEQGENYNPVNQGQAQQPQQKSSSVVANQTIINTTQKDGVPQDDLSGDNGGSKGFKMNPKMAIALVVIGVVVIFFVFSFLGKKPVTEDDNQGQDSSEVYDPFNDPNIEWEIPSTSDFYTLEEKQQLRAAGYTGDEIESYAAAQTPSKDLLRQAEAERDAYIQSAIAPLYDTASDEYKHFISQTWLTLPKREDFPDWKNICMNYSKRENLDYEKIDVYGNQLFIKIYLDDNKHENWFFCSVTPEQWNRLNDSGNIIVNYVYTTRYVGDDILTAVEDTENICIISSSIEFIE